LGVSLLGGKFACEHSDLQNNESLKLLDLSDNQLNLGGGKEDEFVAFQHNNSLQYLILANNRLVFDSQSFAFFRVFMWHLPEVGGIQRT
jgi:hypothetical protein